MSKVLLWHRFVGGELDGEEATGAELMAEGIVDRGGTFYDKRLLIVCEQRILILAESKMGTAAVSSALLRTALRTHPFAADEEPDPVDEELAARHEQLCDRGERLRRREVP